VSGGGNEDAVAVGRGEYPAAAFESLVIICPFRRALFHERLPFGYCRYAPIALEEVPGNIVLIVVILEFRLAVRSFSAPISRLVRRAVLCEFVLGTIAPFVGNPVVAGLP
jgi:hypothetical protein